jgi:hypothetical protein
MQFQRLNISGKNNYYIILMLRVIKYLILIAFTNKKLNYLKMVCFLSGPTETILIGMSSSSSKKEI